MKKNEIYTKVIRSLNTLQKKYDVQVFQFKEFDNILSPYRSIMISLKLSDEIITGIGVDQDPELALTKAYCEFFERWLMVTEKIVNSNGLAGHFCIEKAQINSEKELIERDAYFFHHFNAIAFEPWDYPVQTRLNNIYDTIKTHGLSIKFFKMLNFDNTYSVLCVLEGEGATKVSPFGCLLGMSYENEICAASKKALLECYSMYISQIFNLGVRAISLQQFNIIEKPGVLDHMRLGLNIEYYKEYKKTFLPNKKKHSLSREENVHFDHLKLTINTKMAPAQGLVVNYARSEDLIGIYPFNKGEVSLPFEALHKLPYLLS